MKKVFILAVSALLVCSSTMAKVTYDDAAKHDRELRAKVPKPNQKATFSSSQIAGQSSGGGGSKGGEALLYSVSSGGGTANFKRLAPVADYHCAISKAGSSVSHSSTTTVFKSGSYWWLQVVSHGASGSKDGQAVCFPRG